MNTIVCKNCGVEIEVDKALEGQIEARVLAAERHKHQDELEKLRLESEASVLKERQAAKALTEKQLAGERELLQQQATAELELAKKKIELAASSAQKQLAAEQELTTKQLQDDAATEKAANKQLREQLGEIMTELRAEKQARANADLEAQKKFSAEEAKIREESAHLAAESYRLKIAESEKKLADTQKALADAQRKAEQGSQQNQGEVLELDLENRLREEFPFDEIQEVKKGARGADMKQIVHNQGGASCGMLLWETKNGKWQPAWIAKFKADIREANANIGVIVSQELPGDIKDFKQLENNVWVSSPAFATRLAVALRGIILQVDAATKMNANKDASMEYLFQYLVGPEFRHRVEAIVENYGTLQTEIEKEKRAAALRWAHQEKAIRNVIDNTIGMYGDLQGITNRALPSIKTLELDDGLEEDLIPELLPEATPEQTTQKPEDEFSGQPTLL
ncbi:MAG: hypothetical protein JWM81_1040 [Candidatus Saccharibacteria bacterium]|nr:hypothetical protein [Candidatus Saccharibacteria bacterium]